MRCNLHSIVLAIVCLSSAGLAHGTNPTGSLSAINANTGIATGHASDADRSGQSILIDFWIGPGYATYAGQAVTQANTGAFSFQIPMQYRDGLPRQFCAWAINDTLPHINIGCITFTQASTLPTGTLASISAAGLASGTATDADRPGQSVLVDFWIGTGYTNYVGETATQASTGGYTFQIPAQYHDGVSRSFCAWAINDVQPHVLIGCKSYQFVDHPPTGMLSSVDSNAVARGSANDPDLPGQEVDVKFYRGDNPSTAVYLGHQVTTGGGFVYTITSSKRVSGKICAYATNTQGSTDPLIGCAQYVKPGLEYYGYYTSSTPFRVGQGDYTDEVTDHANLAWIESNDCNVISSSEEDWEYCGIPSSPTLNRQTYVETLPGSGRTIDFFDLMSRVAKAGAAHDKVMLHLEAFLFARSPSGNCTYLRDDADEIIKAVSHQLSYHGLMSTVVAIYPIDEPYWKLSYTGNICHSATDQTPISATADQRTAIYQALTSVLASIRIVDPQTGPRFPQKKTALIMANPVLGWANAPIPDDYDWIGYDGYIATGETTQNYASFLAQLKAKIAVLPNASSKRIMLIPEAYVPADKAEASYSVYPIPEQCTSEVAPPSSFIPSNDGHRRTECILLSNFLKLYRIALCDPTVIAIVPYLWQRGLDAEFPVGSSDRYRDLTNYLVTATLIGGGITHTPYALPLPSCPAQ